MKINHLFRPAFLSVSISLIALFIILLSAPQRLGAAESGDDGGSYLATVDIALIFALHPDMQYYDQNVGLFIKPPRQAAGYQDFLTVIKNRSKDFTQGAEANAPEIKRLKFEIETLKKEIEKLDSLKASEIEAVNQKFAAAGEGEKNNDTGAKNEEMKAIDNKFKTELDNKNKKLSELLDSFEKIQRSLLKIYYLTPEETAKKFEEINAEIRQAILKEAKENGVKSIINLNLLMPKSEKAAQPQYKSIEDRAAFNSTLEGIAASGPDYTKILGALRTFEGAVTKDLVSTRNPEFSESEYLNMLRKMQKDQELEMASNSFFTKEYIMRLAPVKKITASPIVYGGTDLTRGALIKTLTSKGISKEKAGALCDAVLNN